MGIYIQPLSTVMNPSFNVNLLFFFTIEIFDYIELSHLGFINTTSLI